MVSRPWRTRPGHRTHPDYHVESSVATSIEHYLQAERILTDIREGGYRTDVQRRLAVETAQVHATLALAAATALGIAYSDSDSVTLSDWNAWNRAAGEPAG